MLAAILQPPIEKNKKRNLTSNFYIIIYLQSRLESIRLRFRGPANLQHNRLVEHDIVDKIAELHHIQYVCGMPANPNICRTLDFARRQRHFEKRTFRRMTVTTEIDNHRLYLDGEGNRKG